MKKGLWALGLVVACGGTTIVDPGGNGGAGATGGSGGSGGDPAGPTTTTGPTTSSSSGGGTCPYDVPEVFELCVRGEVDPSGGEILSVSSPPYFQLFVGGCYSSSCTVVHEAGCSIGAFQDNELFLDSNFCVEDTSNQGQPCTDDCMSVSASCDSMTLLDGSYEVFAGELSASFTVPMQLPSGGLCVAFDF